MSAINEINSIVKQAQSGGFWGWASSLFGGGGKTQPRAQTAQEGPMDIVNEMDRYLPAWRRGAPVDPKLMSQWRKRLDAIKARPGTPTLAGIKPKYYFDAHRNGSNASPDSRWQDYASTKMMAGMNKSISVEDAYNEIMRRKPGMDQTKARRLAPMVAKNYRIDANGKWVARSSDPYSTNKSIAMNLRRRVPAPTAKPNRSMAGGPQTAAVNSNT